MSLDQSYLTYARRGHGMDHGLYGWSNMFDRAPITWPGDAAVATWIVVSLEWFPILPGGVFKAPGHMETAYPDLRHYSARDYGSRVGIYRLLDAFAKVDARVSIAMNAAIAERYPDIVTDIRAAGHEIVAHSTDMNGTIATGLVEADERALIAAARDRLEKATGTTPRGWLSIARSQSWNTPRLLAEAGFDYMCDWVNDELPFAMTTEGGPILNLPLNHELSDRMILNTRQQSIDDYVTQIQDGYAWLSGEARTYGAGRMLPIHVTPYIVGLPYRIAGFERLLAWLAEQQDNRFMTGSEIADAAAPALAGAIAR